MYELVLYDADGTLLDSLRPHLDFCQDMASEYKIKLTKNEGEIRKNIITPMENFLRSIGFEERQIPNIMKIYISEFAKKYPSRLFPGVKQMIYNIKKKGYLQGIVSSNNKSNLLSSLEDVVEFLDCFYAREDATTKLDGIRKALDFLDVKPENVIFVGDTEKDYIAAKESGLKFLGVNYGWEDMSHLNFDKVDNVKELEHMLSFLMKA